MESSERVTPPQYQSSQAEADDLRAAYQSLRSLMNGTLVALVILTGSLSVFLLREVSLVRAQVHQLNEYVVNYEANSVPIMREFRASLIEFSKVHPDFNQVLAKYFNPTNYSDSAKVAPAPPPSGAPAARMPELPEK